MTLPVDHRETVVAEDLSRYLVTSPRERIAILQGLEKAGELLSLTIGGGDPIITVILEVDPDSGEALIDWARSVHLNKYVVGKELTVSGTLNKIRISFSVDDCEVVPYDDTFALRLPLPDNLIRVQRREHYRCDVPRHPPVVCVVVPPEQSEARPFSLQVRNISVGGMALVDEEGRMLAEPGARFADCKVILPDNKLVIISFEVRNVHETVLKSGKVLRRIGCMFLDPSTQSARLVQRYVTKLQRDEIAKQSLR